MRTGLLMAIVVAAFLPAVVFGQCESTEIVTGTRSAVVKVETTKGTQQSGVVVAKNHVVTVWHGLEGEHGPRVHIDGNWEQAAVVLYDPQSDLALLKVATQAVSPLTVLNRSLQQGESVWAFGWPSGRYQTVGEGIYLGDWRGSMRVTSLVQAGQSGGALIACHSGRALLAGLVTGFGAREVDGTWLREPNMSLAVPAGKLLEFFRQADAVSFARAS